MRPRSLSTAQPTGRGVVAAPRTTMTDVAKAAGVSQTTVSLVLNPNSGAKLSGETRQRVHDAVARLGYRLSRRKEAPAQVGERNLIVYLTDELSTSQHPVFNIDGAREAAWDHGCMLAVYATRGDRALEAATLAWVLAQSSLLGVVYATISTRAVEPPAALGKTTSVLLNCYDAQRRFASVVPGEVAGGHTGTDYLLRLGHRRIGFINGEPWMDASQDRLKGYRQALATADLPFDARLVRDGDWMVGTGYSHALSLMAETAPPSAIFCANDLMAIGAIEALKQLGLQVPADVSVLGYDDQEIARHTHPPLSTVLLPNFELGHTAVETLVELARGKKLQSVGRRRLLKVECPLIERESAAEPAVLAGRGKAKAKARTRNNRHEPPRPRTRVSP